MFWIFANHANYAVSFDNFTIIAHLFYRRPNLHLVTPVIILHLFFAWIAEISRQ